MSHPYRCESCDYRLRGLTEPRCPECGDPFDPDRPWTIDEPRRIRLLDNFVTVAVITYVLLLAYMIIEVLVTAGLAQPGRFLGALAAAAMLTVLASPAILLVAIICVQIRKMRDR